MYTLPETKGFLCSFATTDFPRPLLGGGGRRGNHHHGFELSAIDSHPALVEAPVFFLNAIRYKWTYV